MEVAAGQGAIFRLAKEKDRRYHVSTASHSGVWMG